MLAISNMQTINGGQCFYLNRRSLMRRKQWHAWEGKR